MEEGFKDSALPAVSILEYYAFRLQMQHPRSCRGYLHEQCKLSDGSCMLIVMTDKPRGGLLFLFFPFPVVMTGYCSDWRYKQAGGSEG